MGATILSMSYVLYSVSMVKRFPSFVPDKSES